MKKLFAKGRIRHGFTITEMMVVVAISMIILAMAMAAWVNSDGNANLKRAVRMVNAELNLARSKAIADRKPYRVYFYWNGNTQYCGIYEKDKEPPNDDAIANEAPLPMPGQTFIFLDNPNQTAYVEFDSQGRVSDDKNVSYNNADGIYTIYLSRLIDKEHCDDTYFMISVNEFNGRTSMKYVEAED